MAHANIEERRAKVKEMFLSGAKKKEIIKHCSQEFNCHEAAIAKDLNNLTNDCGIYVLRFFDCYYIGCSTNIQYRFIQHKSALKNNRHSNRMFQNDYNLMGGGKIELSILLECKLSEFDLEESKAILDYMEKGFEVYNSKPMQYLLRKYLNIQENEKRLGNGQEKQINPLTPLKED